MPQHSRRQEGQVQDVRPVQPSPRKIDVWRTADRPPLCYHCREADHVYRRCPYRRQGLRGFHPNDPRPRYGERPREIDEYLQGRQPPEPAFRREFRSPSPRRPASPMHRPRRESLSPLAPRRGNQARQPLEVELPRTTDAKILHERRRAPTRTLPETKTTPLQRCPIT
ncbi:hypothetical protein ISCGN_004808 [Ixodes scapularis]